jgi:hypothetical protein
MQRKVKRQTEKDYRLSSIKEKIRQNEIEDDSRLRDLERQVIEREL